MDDSSTAEGRQILDRIGSSLRVARLACCRGADSETLCKTLRRIVADAVVLEKHRIGRAADRQWFYKLAVMARDHAADMSPAWEISWLVLEKHLEALERAHGDLLIHADARRKPDTAPAARTALGKRLAEIRRRAMENGLELWTAEEVLSEVRRRRAGASEGNVS